MDRESRIYVAGHNGLVGSAVVRALKREGYEDILTVARSQVDLTDPVAVKWMFSVFRPRYVFLCAARVGGIKDNASRPLEFFLQNMAIETNVLMNAAEYGVQKLVYLGSSCIYPKLCPQPIREEYLLTGSIEPTTEAYALAKICGIRLCQWLRQERDFNFVSAMPCNLYGPGDSTDPERAHVIPGLLARMHLAKLAGDPVFKIWGNAYTKREFLFADDLAQALLTVMKKYDSPEPINTGSGDERTIAELAELVRDVVGYSGKLSFDDTQPIGTPRKVLDNSKIEGLGWKPKVTLAEGLKVTYVDVQKRLK